MNQTVETATKGVKELDRQVGAFQMRLDDIKGELAKSRAEKEKLDADIKQIRAVTEQEIAGKVLKARKEASKVEEDRKVLDSQRAELQTAIQELQKQRNAFEREKSDVLAMKESYVQKENRVGRFIRSVREQAELL